MDRRSFLQLAAGGAAAAFTHADRLLLSRLLQERQRRDRSKIRRYFPDCTPACDQSSMNPAHHAGLCRMLYPKHLHFFALGKEFDERLFMAANQIGKTASCGYEVGVHATGEYPHWWPGRVFEPTEDLEFWCAGNSMEATRDILQVELFGPISGVKDGTLAGGMIPPHRIVDRTLKPGAVSFCLHQVWIRWDERHHGAPIVSNIEFKSYDQGRKQFQGTKKHGIWFDEEPPEPPTQKDSKGNSVEDNDIYTEGLMRTINTDGFVIMSYTPMKGLTEFTDRYMRTAQMRDVDGQMAQAHRVLLGRTHDELEQDLAPEMEILRLRAELEEAQRQLQERG